jgi:hypothetical protein
MQGEEKYLSEKLSKAAGSNRTYLGTEASEACPRKEMAYQGLRSFHHQLRKGG